MQSLKSHRFLITLFFSLQISFGWDKTGHRIVAQVASNYLTKNAKLQIKKLLGHQDLSRISNWADEIKSDPSWSHTFDWHYCTIPNGERYNSGQHKGLAVEKSREFIQTLKNRGSTKAEKIIALKFLVHIIGDLHQPLHVGNGTDRGGNDYKVTWFGDETNLHRVWDSHLIDLQKLSYKEYSDYLLLDIDYGDIRKLQADSLTTIIHESQVLREQCYKISDKNLSWRYFYTNKTLLERRLFEGGMRLSGILNRVYK